MVSILHRYVVRELLKSFALSFFALSAVMVLGGLFKPLKLGLSLGQLLKFLPYAIPYSLAWVIPASLLSACVMTYGRLSAENELHAVRASGVPLRYMCYPAFVVALVVTALALPLNDKFIPYCRVAKTEVLREAFRNDPFSLTMIGGQETLELGEHKVYFESIEETANGRVLRKVLVIRPNAGDDSASKRGGRMQVLRADEATWEPMDTDKSMGRIRLKNAQYTIVAPHQSPTRWVEATAEDHHIPILVEEERLKSSRGDTPTARLRQRAAAQRRRLAGAKASKKRKHLERELAHTLTEIHRREALAAASFVLCLVGLPLGIWMRRESRLASFSVAVLVFLMLYALLVGGEGMAMEQKLPPWLGLWGPDFLMGGLGIVLLLHTFRR